MFQRFRLEIIKNYRDRKEEITIRDVELELYVAGVWGPKYNLESHSP